ncbi:hypothetical protein, partial [Streptomyces litmocidini]|uniref:hypothetical protein n=1 Tax=Streptomyces litmocidini TaxID=67318 RepID=UPI001E4A9F90
EGFVHERRVQIAGGRWATQQLVSSHPLTADQAAKLLAREPVTPPQVTPSPRKPAAGEPTTPPTDRHPKKDPRKNTSHLPPEPGETTQTAQTTQTTQTAEHSPRLDEARALIGTLPALSPALRHIPPGMRDELTRLAARWLDAGHTPTDVHAHIRRCLPTDGTPVHRPGGLVRHLLRDVPPREPHPPATTSTPATTPAPGNQLSPRLRGTRECAGDHTQATLFRPVGDETHCAACASQAARGAGVVVAVAP